jgi:RHS repeat-associated protein
VNGSPNISSNNINNSSNTGIYVSNGSPTISGNSLSGGSGNNYGVVIAGGTVTIESNNISQFPNYEAIKLGSAGATVSGSVYGNTISSCKYPLGFTGDRIPSITFNANDISGCSLNGINLSVSLASGTIPTYSLPYVVSGLSINSGATVDISPGSIFKMPNTKSLFVNGTLNTNGTADSPVIFTSLKDDTFGGDTNNDGTATTPQPGDWNLINLAASSKIDFNYATIRYGNTAIYRSGADPEISVSNCEISNMNFHGIEIYSCTNVTVSDNKIHHNGSYGIYSSSSSPEIINNEISYNSRGIKIFGSSSAFIAGNNFHNNNEGIQIMMQSGDTNACKISYNNFENNTYYGLDNWSANQPPVAVAKNNWWGDASGPRPIGSGDQINSTTLVDVYPWLEQKFISPNPKSLLGRLFWQFYCGDPVNSVTGNFTYDKTDLEIPTRGVPLKFARFYNSLDSEVGPLGRGWQHNYNCSVILNADNSATVLYPDGHQTTFPYNNGSYTRPLACYETLTGGANGFLLTFKDQTVFEFNSTGLLTAVKDKNNNINSLSYSGTLLQSVTDPAGRSLQFQYWPDSRLKQVSDPAGRTVSFSYDAGGNLASCTDVKGGVWNYGYTGGLLSSITDPGSHQIAANTYDTEGRVTAQSDGENNTTNYSYAPDTRLNTMTDARGNTATFSYDMLYRVGSIGYPGGVHESFAYDANNNRTGVEDKNGATTNYTYDNMGNLLTRTDPAPLSYVTTYTYDSRNNPTQVIDAAGYSTDYTYDIYGNPLTVSRAVYSGTATTTFAYNSCGQVTGITNANGKVTQMAYDQYGNQGSVTDPLGHTNSYTYDMAGRKLTTTDPLNHTTIYTYDNAGNVLTVTDPLGNVTTSAYDADSNRTSVTDPLGHTISFTYNHNDKLVTTTDALGRTTTYGYDAENNLTSVTDPLNHTTTYTYDYLNRLTSRTDANGRTETYTLDGNGNRVSKTDRNGNTTTYTYDVLNRLTSVTDALSNSAATEYDALGNKTSVTDQRGKVTSFTYDQSSRLLSATDPLGGFTAYTYDLVGNKLSVTDARGACWSYTYDDANRPITVTDPLGHTSVTGYDSAGNVTGRTDANNMATTFGYDSVNRLSSVTDALGRSTSYTYDNNGNLTTVTNAKNQTFTATYDALNRVVQESDPLGNTSLKSYDYSGNLSSMTRPDGSAINYSYDAGNRLTYISYPDQTSVTYAYDYNGNRTSMTDPAGSASYSYDSLNRLTSVARSVYSVGYEYDQAGNMTALVYPGGLRISYTYNSLNLPVSVSDSVYSTSISYDQAGNRTQETLPNGVTVTYEYDLSGRLTLLQHADGGNTIARSAYTLDNVGNRMSVTDEQGGITSYTYDNLYQLTRVTYPDSQAVDYTYDQAGNRTSAGGVAYTYDNANRLIQVGTTPYAYDVNGNLISVGGTTQYTYDYENRLTYFTDGTKTIQYTYDGDGNRLSQSVSGSVYEYIYDINTGIPRLLVEKDEQGGVNNYLYSGRLFSRIANEDRIYYHQDGLGSISAITDIAANVLNRYTYDVFGLPRSVLESVNNSFRFAGEQYDANDLIYLRARYYNPAIGRFLSQDTFQGKLNDPLSQNRYAYCGNNPVLYVDPTGHMKICELRDELNKLWPQLDFITKIKSLNSVNGALSTVIEYDERISQVSAQLGVPKEMIQAIIYREQICLGIDDPLADLAVQEYYTVYEPSSPWPQALLYVTNDSSTGLGQIFAATAIEAEIYVNKRSDLDPKNETHIWDMWQKLQDNNTNINYVGLVLLKETEGITEDLQTASRDGNINAIERVLAKYNGTGSGAATYGAQTMQYYYLFKQYNSEKE